MSVDATGRRAARIARIVTNVTWWLGLALSALATVLVLAAPFLQGMGLAARFKWNSFALESGAEVPALVVRVATRTEPAWIQLSSDTTAAQGPTLRPSGVADLELRTTSWPFVLASNATLLLYLAATLWGVHLLRTFLADVLSRQTFTLRNAARLSRLGWLVMALAVVGPLLEKVRTSMILERFQVSGAALGPAKSDDSALWLVGLLALVLAAAWRHGADLQQQSDLTV